jgi:hypothetical protein
MTSVATEWGPLCEPLHTDREIDPDGPAWRENAFFTFWDRRQNVYGQIHFTTSANAGARKGRAEISVDNQLFEIVEELAPMSFQSESINVDLGGMIRVRAADFQLDLETRPRFPGHVADYSQSDTVPSLVEGQPLQHFQASGTFTAELRTADGTKSLSGVNFRDRTWGYREDSSWQEYYGFMCCFDSFDLTFLKFMNSLEDQRARGFYLGGVQGEITQTTVTERDSLGTIRAVDLTMADGTSRSAIIDRSACRPVFVPAGIPRGPRAITVYDEFQPLRFADGEGGEGLGFVEQCVLRQLA